MRICTRYDALCSNGCVGWYYLSCNCKCRSRRVCKMWVIHCERSASLFDFSWSFISSVLVVVVVVDVTVDSSLKVVSLHCKNDEIRISVDSTVSHRCGCRSLRVYIWSLLCASVSAERSTNRWTRTGQKRNVSISLVRALIRSGFTQSHWYASARNAEVTIVHSKTHAQKWAKVYCFHFEMAFDLKPQWDGCSALIIFSDNFTMHFGLCKITFRHSVRFDRFIFVMNRFVRRRQQQHWRISGTNAE